VPKRLKVAALLGGTKSDLRDALIGSGVTEVKVMACLGGVEVIVPPHVDVECEGIGILGGFGISEQPPTDPKRPVVRVSGFALLGGVEVSSRLRGESAKQAKKRLKAERKKELKDNPRKLLK
jgi:hypothetical protein